VYRAYIVGSAVIAVEYPVAGFVSSCCPAEKFHAPTPAPPPPPSPPRQSPRAPGLRLRRPSHPVVNCCFPKGWNWPVRHGWRCSPRGVAMCRAARRCIAAAIGCLHCSRYAAASSRPASAPRTAATRSSAFTASPSCWGLDGIGTGRHHCDAVALENAQVCSISYRSGGSDQRSMPELRQRFHPHHEPRIRRIRP